MLSECTYSSAAVGGVVWCTELAERVDNAEPVDIVDVVVDIVESAAVDSDGIGSGR